MEASKPEVVKNSAEIAGYTVKPQVFVKKYSSETVRNEIEWIHFGFRGQLFQWTCRRHQDGGRQTGSSCDFCSITDKNKIPMASPVSGVGCFIGLVADNDRRPPKQKLRWQPSNRYICKSCSIQIELKIQLIGCFLKTKVSSLEFLFYLLENKFHNYFRFGLYQRLQ